MEIERLCVNYVVYENEFVDGCYFATNLISFCSSLDVAKNLVEAMRANNDYDKDYFWAAVKPTDYAHPFYDELEKQKHGWRQLVSSNGAESVESLSYSCEVFKEMYDFSQESGYRTVQAIIFDDGCVAFSFSDNGPCSQELKLIDTLD